MSDNSFERANKQTCSFAAKCVAGVAVGASLFAYLSQRGESHLTQNTQLVASQPIGYELILEDSLCIGGLYHDDADRVYYYSSSYQQRYVSITECYEFCAEDSECFAFLYDDHDELCAKSVAGPDLCDADPTRSWGKNVYQMHRSDGNEECNAEGHGLLGMIQLLAEGQKCEPYNNSGYLMEFYDSPGTIEDCANACRHKEFYGGQLCEFFNFNGEDCFWAKPDSAECSGYLETITDYNYWAVDGGLPGCENGVPPPPPQPEASFRSSYPPGLICYPIDDLGYVSHHYPEQCFQKCLDHPSCNAFAYSAEGGDCLMTENCSSNKIPLSPTITQYYIQYQW